MFRLIEKIPRSCYVACSGGVDSMGLLSFVQNNPSNDVEVLFFDHGTEASRAGSCLLRDYCSSKGITIHRGYLTRERRQVESPEEFWRNERYAFFNEFQDRPILMGHHLDDAVENYVFTMLNGRELHIPSRRGNYYRPFLLCEKEEIINWCRRKEVPWIEDDSNSELRYARNRIRAEILPAAYKVNPGLRKVVAKKLIETNKGVSGGPQKR